MDEQDNIPILIITFNHKKKRQGFFSKAIKEAKEQGFKQKARDLILLRFGFTLFLYSIFCLFIIFISVLIVGGS